MADVRSAFGAFLAFYLADLHWSKAASLSTTATGLVSDRFGESSGFFTMAGIAAVGAITLWLWLPESRPKEYTD